MHFVLTWSDAAVHLWVAKFPFVPRDVKMGNLRGSFFCRTGKGKNASPDNNLVSPPLSIVFFKTTA